MIGQIKQNLQEASMEGPLQDFFISPQLDKNMVAMGNSCFIPHY